MSFDARTFLADLKVEVAEHPGVNHTFLARVGTSPFTREDYKVFEQFIICWCKIKDIF